jgi:hypothetical protein
LLLKSKNPQFSLNLHSLELSVGGYVKPLPNAPPVKNTVENLAVTVTPIPVDKTSSSTVNNDNDNNGIAFQSFSAFIDLHLLRGLSGLLPMETTLFVWDQCFIFGFHSFLPLVITSLLLGSENEVNGLTSLEGVVNTLVSFMGGITILRLQRY